MFLNKAKEYLKNYHLEDRILVFDESSATVKEAALRLNCQESEIAKTLAFFIQDKPIVILMAGDAKCKNGLFKQVFHEKAKMIPFENVEDIIGYPPGGVCPFGINPGVRVYLDESLKRFEFVYPACGSSNSAIKLTIPELEKYANYVSWVDVSK